MYSDGSAAGLSGFPWDQRPASWGSAAGGGSGAALGLSVTPVLPGVVLSGLSRLCRLKKSALRDTKKVRNGYRQQSPHCAAGGHRNTWLRLRFTPGFCNIWLWMMSTSACLCSTAPVTPRPLHQEGSTTDGSSNFGQFREIK